MDLPLELKNEILRRVSIKEYPKIALVCRALREVLKNEYLWQHIYNQKGVKTYRDSYLDSVKRYLKRRWKWDPNDTYILNDHKTLITRSKEDDNNPHLQTKNPITQKRNRIKIKIESPLKYLYIGLIDKSKVASVSKEYWLQYIYNRIVTYVGEDNISYNRVLQPVNLFLKEGDIVDIRIKDHKPMIKLNNVNIELNITEAIIEKLNRNNKDVYPTIGLEQGGCIRIINE